MKYILLSIVIPTFRRENLLQPLLSAIAAQLAALPEWAEAEVIVVDNSPEASACALDGSVNPPVRFIHEPRRGVAHVRNIGVRSAQGTHIVFIDDDELPASGWLAAFAVRARGGDDACFGPVEPHYETAPPETLKPLLDRIFHRDLGLESGTDVSCHRAYLGSGNSMFSRRVLGNMVEVFDPSFNTGGEDVLLLRHLVDDLSVTLTWAPEAKVLEIVPTERLTPQFVARRLFCNGQLRCRVEAEAGIVSGLPRVLFWMAAGTAQFLGFMVLSIAYRPFNKDRSLALSLRSMSGKGKLLWWSTT